MTKKYCWYCKCEQIFDDSFDEDCLRCSECGSLPYEYKMIENRAFIGDRRGEE